MSTGLPRLRLARSVLIYVMDWMQPLECCFGSRGPILKENVIDDYILYHCKKKRANEHPDKFVTEYVVFSTTMGRI